MLQLTSINIYSYIQIHNVVITIVMSKICFLFVLFNNIQRKELPRLI